MVSSAGGDLLGLSVCGTTDQQETGSGGQSPNPIRFAALSWALVGHIGHRVYHYSGSWELDFESSQVYEYVREGFSSMKMLVI